MPLNQTDAPQPDLRIVLTDSLHPHEDHDSQRSQPLMERLASETVVINPPIVAPMGASQFLVLDGANRFHAFSYLNYPHILVQVAPYENGYVDLKTWRHLVCDWQVDLLIEHIKQLGDIQIVKGQVSSAIAHILLRDESVLALVSPVENTHERNAALRQVVRIYQQNATLQRTALVEPSEIWTLHPTAIAIFEFPHYQPADIIAAARFNAYLPPGISRHIIQGRALKVNYPLALLRDHNTSLSEKNEYLRQWVQAKLTARQVRYYAESSYLFDE
ncbi:MAG: hypothetical protein GC179_18065 [Anaerolineaceae bacterium]|nr:hypothetical protein [Anaerolineaceae bacterium]